MTDFRYKAFISYSHQDESWARWLQRALESYRVPGRLVGTNGDFGKIPARLTPVFRDREDLSSAASLTDSVTAELTAAETLIVICSPAAAQSHWVNEEISLFRSLGREGRIYALIVDGDPQAADEKEQCFPPALLRNERGAELEPLAADARKWGDGRFLAKLKLVAGILGIRLDELRQREMQRRRRNRTLGSVVTIAIVLLTAFLATSAIISRKASEQRRASTEELLSYMLGTVENLSPVSGLDVLDADQQEMTDLAEQQGFRLMADEALLQKSLDWREEGMAARNRGDGVAAMDAFSSSLAALVSLYQRDRRQLEHLFELGQAEFWVGYVHWDNGDLDQAEESFTRYGVITRRLINADPRSAENVIELSYSLINLGLIETAREGADHDKAIRLMQAGLEYNQIAIVLEPENQVYIEEMAVTHAHLADSWQGVCNLGKAYQFREENVQIARDLLTKYPDESRNKELLAYALSGTASVQQLLGINELALENLRRSEALLGELARAHPDNRNYTWEHLVRLRRIGALLPATGEREAALAMVTRSAELMADEAARAPLQPWQVFDQATGWMILSDMARELAALSEAGSYNKLAVDALSSLVAASPGVKKYQTLLAGALFQYWQLHGTQPPAELVAMTDDHSLNEPPARSCALAALASRQAIMRGDKKTASDYTSYLLGKGYYEPGFIVFCEAYGLCGEK